MSDKYLAHLRKDGESEIIQTVEEHCRNTAEIASESLRNIGLANTSYVAGIIHDAGKYTQKFSDYIRGGNGRRGSVIHTFTGVKMVLDRYHDDSSNGKQSIASEIIAYAAGAHHGLFDCIDESQKSGFLHRTRKDDNEYSESFEAFKRYCISESELDQLMDKASEEISRKIQVFKPKTDDELYFYLGMITRTVLSSVVEGDRTDTANFMKNTNSAEKDRFRIPDWVQLLSVVEQKINKLPRDTEINKARHRISDQCKCFAETNPNGIYQLNVPTGSGKTLSSLRFALAHAAKEENNISRLIFVSPLLSILDQNAKEIRKYVGDDKIVLEHHSNIVNQNKDKVQNDKEREKLDKKELLIESWNSPIIITTMVQFLNTLFSGKMSCVRRMHALCNSVIVIDEVQTVPSRLLSMFHLAMNYLCSVCGATIILCSATQPCNEASKHPMNMDSLNKEIVPYEESLWKVFKRTEIQVPVKLRFEEVSAFVADKLGQCESLLVICNTKKEASEIFSYFKANPEISCYHLSASMCMDHREKTLDDLKASLSASKEQGKKVLCVSTQVIEAGVDISFECVIRLSCGLDEIIQSAGRCNRNGEFPEIKPVYVIQCMDEKLGPLDEIREGKGASEALMDAMVKNPKKFLGDFSSNQSVEFYYKKLYKNYLGNHQDYSVKKYGTTLLDLLSVNEKFNDEDCEHYPNLFSLSQSFRLAAELFSVFEEDTFDVIVPFGEGSEIIQSLEKIENPFETPKIKELLNEARPYTVSVHKNALESLLSIGMVRNIIENSVYILERKAYDNAIGVLKANEVLQEPDIY